MYYSQIEQFHKKLVNLNTTLLALFGNSQNLYVTKEIQNLTTFMMFVSKGILKLRKMY